MINTKPIHLRSDEYNEYIEECKQPYVVQTGELDPSEKNIIYRTGVDYGLEIHEALGAKGFTPDPKDYNIIFRIKGPFTMPDTASFTTERGVIKVRPYVIHESATAQRLKEVAEDLVKREMVGSPVPIDAEYMHEALRETAFTIAMEEVVRLGKGFQIVQIDFDTNGHFKALELDETHY